MVVGVNRLRARVNLSKIMELKLRKNFPLAPLTTFKIGGPADYFFEVRNLKELKMALFEMKKKNLPFFILGGGSNLLIADEGFRGGVIKINNDKIKIKKIDDHYEFICGAGCLLSELLRKSLEKEAIGLEWAIGIPGTVGGATCGNSGAYGHSFGELIKEVEVFNPLTFKREILPAKKCQFSYRESIFKKEPLIIWQVSLILKKGSRVASEELMKAYLQERKTKIPPYPSAGSVFKNIEVEKLDQKLLEKIPSEKIKGGKIAVAYLIEKAGLKGKRIGGAEISSQHANFIVNKGRAKAKDVLALIELVKKTIKKKFNLDLELEIRLVGFSYEN